MMRTPTAFTGSFEQSGYFAGRYRVEIAPYEGLDFSRRCWVFPGQTAAGPGMLKHIVESEPRLRELLLEADALSGKPVSRYILEPSTLGSDEARALRLPALFALQVALARHLLEKGIQPAALTAHSFGEYAALVISGIARFEDVFELVVLRDELSRAHGAAGVMIAVAASATEVAAVLPTGSYYVSNLNSPRQTVISVRPADERKTLSSLKSHRLSAAALKDVPWPYHTPLMAEVGARLAETIAARGWRFQAPEIPIFSSVTGEWITRENWGGEGSIRRLIAEQITQPVAFAEQIQAIMGSGVLNFIEVGPGEACGEFIRTTTEGKVVKITPLERYFNVSTEKRAVMGVSKSVRITKDNSGLLGRLSRVIAAVTGYNVDEISIQDNFQEDLGIDSIKKAEIVFKFMESMKDPASGVSQVNLSQIKRVEDVLEQIERAEASSQRADAKPPRFERSIAVWREAPLSDFERLSEVPRADIRTIELDEIDPRDLAELDSLRPGSLLILLARRVAELKWQEPRLEFATRLQALIDALRARETAWPVRIALVCEDGAHPYAMALDGFFKSWLREEGFAAFRSIEIADLHPGIELAALVAEQFLDARFIDLRFENGRRLARRWEPRASKSNSELPARPVVVSIGGGRGIGSEILLELLHARPEARLIILGRSAATESRTQRTLERLRAIGRDVSYVQADATQAQALRAVLAPLGHIDLLLNGSGAELSRSLKGKSGEEIWTEFAGKVAPISEIAALLSERAIKVERILNYSSIAAAFGNPGQTIYALGNQIMSAIGARLSALGLTRATTIVLPPWDGLGMTENEMILNSLRARGITLLPRDVGCRLMVDEMTATGSEPVAFLDWNDARAYDCDLIDRAAYVDLFKSTVSSLAPVEIPRLNLRDQAYLRDHRINGNIIYPASSALAMMTYAAYLHFQEFPVIENFEVKAFLSPEEDSSRCRLEIEVVSAERIRMKLSSARAVHYAGEAVREARPATEPAYPTFVQDLEVWPEPLYVCENVAFGKHFQLGVELWLNRQRDMLQVSRQSALTRYTSLRAFDRLQQWFESTLQALGGHLLWHARQQFVPAKIGRIACRFDRGLSDELWHRAHIHRLEGDTCFASAQATNAEGRVVIEMTGIEDMRVGGRQLDEHFHVRRSHDERWRPLGADERG